MDKNALYATAAVAALGAAVAAYVFWPHKAPPPPPPAQTAAIAPPPAPALIASQPVAPVPPPPPLPALAHSDDLLSGALSALLNDAALMKLFHRERIIRDIVATVDNLPQQRLAANIMPFNPPRGRFLVSGSEGHLSISPRNAARYAAYLKMAEAVDSRKLVELYVRLYPLFQQAYRDLGYPNGNFNDQLNDTLDDLLDTPVVKDPVRLVQPKYFYQYADPDLEARSVGQKIMLRLGSKNREAVRSKLAEIKQELAKHASELNATGTN